MFDKLPDYIQNIILRDLLADDFPSAKRTYDSWRRLEKTPQGTESQGQANLQAQFELQQNCIQSGC